MSDSPPRARPPERDALPQRSAVDGAAMRRIDSQDLLSQRLEVEIVHGSQTYRLRQTSLGKLILTK